MSVILGINAFHADASAALIINGEIKMKNGVLIGDPHGKPLEFI